MKNDITPLTKQIMTTTFTLVLLGHLHKSVIKDLECGLNHYLIWRGFFEKLNPTHGHVETRGAL